MLHLKPIRLNHVTVAAPLDGKVAARRFYGEILGLPEIHIPPVLSGAFDMVWYKILDWELHVVFTDDWTDKPVLSRHFALEIEDYHEFRAHLEKNGVPLTEGVPLPDRERFYFQDPFQIYFEVIKLNTRS